jgi:hypothetical protein
MQTRVIRTVAALWAALFLASFLALLVTEPAGDGFTRGLNRLASFMTWQGVAFLPAIVCAFLAYRSAGGDAPQSKLLGYGPLAASVILIALLIAIIAFRVLVQPALA